MDSKRITTDTVLGIAAGLMLVAALASAGVVLWAQAPSRPGATGAMGHGFRRGPLQMLNFAARQLNLTDVQTQQIKDVVRGRKAEIKGLVDDWFAARKALRQAVDADNSAAIADAIKRMSDVERSGAQLKAQIRSEIFNTVRNADQRAKAASLEQRFDQRADGLRQRIDQFLDQM